MPTAPAVLTALQEHGAGGGGGLPGPFALEPGLIIWTWVVFLALFFLLRRFAWPTILKATEERERRIARQLSESERLNAEAQKTLEEHKQLLSGARHEAHELLAGAKAAAEKEREQMLARARQEQQQVLERAKKEIAAEKDRAVAELRREAVDLSLAAASKLLREKIDGEADRRLVERYLTDLEERH
jgi:F-type H+-transporting ATPase subunit b